MKVRSIIELPYNVDRLGIKRSIIEIDLFIESKDDKNKIYYFKAIDYRFYTDEEKLVMYQPIPDTVQISSKIYSRTYTEYDAQKEYLLSLKTYTETGSDLEDALVQDALLYSLMIDPIYESLGTDWVKYSDPVVLVPEPIVPPVIPPMYPGPTGTSGTSGAETGTSGTSGAETGTSGTSGNIIP
jgi:hypothetical protein